MRAMRELLSTDLPIDCWLHRLLRKDLHQNLFHPRIIIIPPKSIDFCLSRDSNYFESHNWRPRGSSTVDLELTRALFAIALQVLAIQCVTSVWFRLCVVLGQRFVRWLVSGSRLGIADFSHDPPRQLYLNLGAIHFYLDSYSDLDYLAASMRASAEKSYLCGPLLACVDFLRQSKPRFDSDLHC